MASELKVDTIKHTNNTSAITLDTSGNVTLAGSANNLGTISAGTFNGTIGSSATLPAGTVLQYLHFENQETNGLSGTYTNLYEKSITLKSASSDVFISFQTSYQLNVNQGFGFKIYRNNSATVTTSHTAIWTINSANNTGPYHIFNGSNNQANNILSVNAKDSLSGFSVGDELFYGLFFRIYDPNGGSMQIPTGSAVGGSGQFVMQLMEVQK